MALGNSGIAAARSELNTISTKLAVARESNNSFSKLYTDENFQKFVAETTKGTTANDQLKQLIEWISSMCETVQGMVEKTQRYLDRQEELNSK